MPEHFPDKAVLPPAETPVTTESDEKLKPEEPSETPAEAEARLQQIYAPEGIPDEDQEYFAQLAQEVHALEAFTPTGDLDVDFHALTKCLRQDTMEASVDRHGDIVLELVDQRMWLTNTVEELSRSQLVDQDYRGLVIKSLSLEIQCIDQVLDAAAIEERDPAVIMAQMHEYTRVDGRLSDEDQLDFETRRKQEEALSLFEATGKLGDDFHRFTALIESPAMESSYLRSGDYALELLTVRFWNQKINDQNLAEHAAEGREPGDVARWESTKLITAIDRILDAANVSNEERENDTRIIKETRRNFD